MACETKSLFVWFAQWKTQFLFPWEAEMACDEMGRTAVQKQRQLLITLVSRRIMHATSSGGMMTRLLKFGKWKIQLMKARLTSEEIGDVFSQCYCGRSYLRDSNSSFESASVKWCRTTSVQQWIKEFGVQLLWNLVAECQFSAWFLDILLLAGIFSLIWSFGQVLMRRKTVCLIFGYSQ